MRGDHPRLDMMRTVRNEVYYTVRAALAPIVLRPLPYPRPLPGRRPVVLVHGFLGHQGMFRPLARRLLNEGWPKVERVGR